MKLRNLFLGAIAMVAAFSACEEQADEALGGNPSIELVGLEGDEISFDADGGESQVALIANRNWTIEEDATWIEVTPTSGSASGDQQVVTIKVLKNELDEDDPTAGFDREDDIKFTVGAKSTYLTIKQAGPQGSTEALVVYYNNFDVEKAEKGENGWATYLDTWEGWHNEEGTGAESVTYEYDRMTARTNSGNGSAGKYSIYDGSGMNYLWFGSGKPYFTVKEITLPEGKVNFTISFGTERYLYEAEDNTFNWDEFKAYVSIDGVKWSVLACEFAGEALPNGQWDLASATIKVTEGTAKLYIHFASALESAYAIDDLKVEESLIEGVAIDFAAGEEFKPEEPEQGGESDATAIYSNNYDKEAAVKGEKGYPYLDQFDGWMNHAGTGAENVTYSYNGVSVRSNSNSDGSYSDYEGSGMNNIFFGKNAYFSTNNIALNGATTLTLTFGTEKYSQDNGSVFTNSEFHIFLSNDGGKKWVELVDYTFAGGTTEGKWNIATANFTVPAGTETLSICMQVDVASSYRLDDFKLVAGTEAGTAVDFSQAVEKDFGAGSGTVTPPAGEITDVTVAEFNAKPIGTALYRLTGTVGGPINTQYGNFDLIDETGKVYVYGISNWSEYSSKVAEGGTITVVGQRGDYNGKIEVLEGYIENYTEGEGGGNEGGEDPVADAIYSNNYDKTEATKTYGSNGNSYPYLDQFDGWMNHAGTGAANVTYAFSGMSARSNSTSDGTYSDYEGSGMNNIFFGKSAYFATNNIVLDGATDLTLTFGTEKYSQTDGSVFTNSEYHIWLSNDGGKKWVEFTDYTFAGGTTAGRWNVATANFTVPAGTETLSICMQVDVASAYRLDDFKLVAGTEAGTAVDFSQAVEKDFGAGSGTVTPPAGEITDVTVAEFNAKPIGTALYRLTGTVGGPINTQYGNFDLIDETGKVYVYGISNWSEYSSKVAEGGTVTVVGQRGDYNGKIEVLEGYIESYTEGGETPEAPETPVTPGEVVVATVAEFLAAAEGETIYELTGTITRIAAAYNSEYNNITYYLADATGETYIYRMSCEGVADPLSLTAGDEITVQGKRSSYNGVPQMAKDGKYISHVDNEAPAPENGTYTLDFSDVNNRVSLNDNEQIWEQNGIKLTNNRASSTSKIADYSAPARFYKSTSLKIEKAGMNKMVFLCNSGKNTGPADLKTSVTDANATVTVDGMTVTITFATSVDVFEIATLAGQVRVDVLTVYAE